MAATACRRSRSTRSQRELGIIVEATGKTREAAVLLASLLTHYLIHYGYPGRKATAGNIAYPLSPNLVSFAARGRFVRRHRAERNARSCVLRELCRDQGRRAEADRG